MGNKRQRVARQRFKVVSGSGDVQAEPEKDVEGEKREASKSGKKKNGRKRKRADGGGVKNDGAKATESPEEDEELKVQEKTNKEDGKTNKKQGSKHPLRVAGMRPGEGCFLCKGTDHIAKLCPQKSVQDRKKICLSCRKIGHTVKICPNIFGSQDTKFCYNCGEHGHRLADCKKPLTDGGTKFAECFVCKGKGHLSKSCPSNPHGIYPKGGSCKLCGGVTHLAKDCSKKVPGHREKLQISTEAAKASQPGEGGKRIVFKSGDDLEDDFVAEGELGSIDYGSDGDSAGGTLGKKSTPKMKKLEQKNSLADSSLPLKSYTKMQTPKVVKFQRP